MNNKKICFVICYNQEVYLNECLLYIYQLHIPDGYSMDILTILDAPSMTMGYQAAMEESDAKYKIYIHQDVFILYRYFLDTGQSKVRSANKQVDFFCFKGNLPAGNYFSYG